MLIQLLELFLTAISAGVFLVPLLWFYHVRVLHDLRRTLWYGVLAFYLAALLSLVGFPSVLSLTFDCNLNLIPFTGMAGDVSSVLNIFLFLPLGVLLPLLWEKFRSPRSAALAGLCMSAAIELSQLFTLRATDVNDLMTNTLGTLLGFLAAKAVTGNFTRLTPAGGKPRDARLITSAVAAVMFLLQPLVESALWQALLESPLWQRIR